MKKLFAFFIAVLTACLLCACSLSFDSGEARQIGGASGEHKGTDEAGQPNSPNADASIEEQICFEHEGVRVTAKSMTNNSIRGTGINLLVENDTERDYFVSARHIIVNNCMVSTLFSCEVAAGKKANDTLYLSSSALKAAGIGNIGQIELYFYVYDSETYETVYDAECVTLKTTLFDTMDIVADDTGYELYHQDGIRIVGKYVDENTFWGSSVLLYIENKTDRNITVTCDDMSINGYMVTVLLSSTVYQGKYAVDHITVFSASLEENGITSIDTVELKFHIFDSDTLETIANTDAIGFNAQS